MVVSHPAVGSGVETVLRLERRYELRRVAKLGEAGAVAKTWPADAALVDAAMLRPGDRLALGVPAVVLAGGDAESRAVSGGLDDPRGWVRKDAPAADLIRAVEQLLTAGQQSAAGSLALLALGVLVLVFGGLLFYLIWLALV